MEYDTQEFCDLVAQVEAAGGEHLDRMCQSKVYNFTGPKSRELLRPGCGNVSFFAVPYEALDVKGREAGGRTVDVCAVDDDMGKWPRFGGDRFGRAGATQ